MNTYELTKLDSTDAIETHIFELHTISTSSSNQDLGFLSSERKIELTIGDDDYIIEQSPSLLTSNSISSSTGYVTWRVTVPFLNWLLYHESQPYYSLLNTNLDVVELGSGVAGLVVSSLGRRRGHVIGTDQSQLIKPLKRNVVNNSTRYESSTLSGSTTKARSKIDIVELDWEDPDYGIQELQRLGMAEVDMVIACDTVYNMYLIPHLVDTILQISNPTTIILIAIHLRDLEVVEFFLKHCLNHGLGVSYIDDSYLTDELKDGFAIYQLHKS